MTASNALINRQQLTKLVPASAMTIWRWEKAGRFPRRLRIGGRNYWSATEVADWIEAQAAARSEGGRR